MNINRCSKLLRSFTIIVMLTVVAVASNATEQVADVIYTGGDIVTMNPNQRSAEAVAIKGGRIVAVGTQKEVMTFRSASTEVIDLDRSTLLPGFIDAHGHFGAVGLLARSANIAARPDGNTTDISSLLDNLREHLDNPVTAELGWILGMNYDDSQLVGKVHPTALDLDKVSTDLPIMILHQSGHLGVVNTKGLELLGYDESTVDPAGGLIRRVAGSLQPNGVLEESALFGPLVKIATPKTAAGLLGMMKGGQDAYVKAGFTTAQEGRATPGGLRGLQAAAATKLLNIDVVAYPDPTLFAEGPQFEEAMSNVSRGYSDHYRIGGLKLSLDGSPQGKTAWLKQPYHVPPEGHGASYVGYPALKPGVIDRYVQQAFKNKWQVLIHTNGDAASDQFITSLSKALEEHPNKDLRPVAIHAQVIREDQLDAMNSLGAIPSFMSVHTFYWGDWHRDSVLGEKRALRISPAKSALDRGMIYTSHNDAPVTLPNALMILSSQVNRTTRSGKILGKEQRVSVLEALKSITINAAYQYFEENIKGSIEPGKLADMVILDKNPLKIDSKDLTSIRILETIKEGKSIYRSN